MLNNFNRFVYIMDNRMILMVYVMNRMMYTVIMYLMVNILSVIASIIANTTTTTCICSMFSYKALFLWFARPSITTGCAVCHISIFAIIYCVNAVPLFHSIL